MAHRNGRVVLLSTPSANRDDASLTAAYAIQRLSHLGLDVEHLVATDRRHAIELSYNAAATRPEAFVAVGGDRVANVALQALHGSDIPLGIVPAGLGGDLARSLGIPRDDPTRAADIIAAGRTRRIDLARAEFFDGTSAYYVTGAGADYYADVLEMTQSRLLAGAGRFRYLTSAIVTSWTNRPNYFRITDADGRDLSGEYTLATVANLPSVGGGLAVAPGADPQDGLLDLTTVTKLATQPFQALRILRRSARGGLYPDQSTQFHRSTSFTIDSPGRDLAADGAVLGRLPVTITAVPDSLSVIVP